MLPQKLSSISIMLILLIITFIGVTATSVMAQGTLQQQPLNSPRNPELELEAKHNLEVARFYMKRKAYKGVTDRLLEVSYTYPQFSRFDEVLSLLAEAFLKQDKKEQAAKFYQQLVDEFPESEFSKEAKKQLPNLPKVNNTPH